MNDPTFSVVNNDKLNIVMFFDAANELHDLHHVDLVNGIGQGCSENSYEEFLLFLQLTEHGVFNGLRGFFIEFAKRYLGLPEDYGRKCDHDAYDQRQYRQRIFRLQLHRMLTEQRASA